MATKRNPRQRKERSRAKANKAAVEAAAPSDQGNGAILLTDPRHQRADARMAARLFSLGIISEDQAKQIISAGFGMLAAAAAEGHKRNYCRLYKLILDTVEMERRAEPEQADVTLHAGPSLKRAFSKMTDAELLAIEKLDELMASDDVIDEEPEEPHAANKPSRPARR